ncbi:MAG TPA: D-alanyl-D-alanine carboxypeptidase family protein [Ktedonobacterales bacterium]
MRRGGKRQTLLVYILLWVLVLLPSLALMSYSLLRIATVQAATERTQTVAPLATSLPAPSVTAVAAYLLDADTGAVYYAKGADEERPMASTTKIMTALLAVERGNLDQVITVGPDAQALVRHDSSYMGVTAGEQLTLRDLLYGLLLPSGNDAAVAIADGIAGSQDAFVALMNARAAGLGLTHTHYANPHGLDAPDHYTTARDLAMLAELALQQPVIVQIASTLHYSIPKTATHKAYELQTGNDLLAGARSPYPGAMGLKPGFTGGAGYTMAFAARRHGHLIIGAVLGDPSWQVRILDMRILLNWGFEQYGISKALPVNPGSQPVASDL